MRSPTGTCFIFFYSFLASSKKIFSLAFKEDTQIAISTSFVLEEKIYKKSFKEILTFSP